ncbi:MAG: lipoyl(octanoyl) transferase LipB [Alistipes sp.]|nr:lipoyl(octanoyl) transferase LipB [Alistipes sp.]
MKGVLYKDLGRMGYSECWDLQRSLFDRALNAKRNGGAKEGGEEAAQSAASVAENKANDLGAYEAGWLLLVEHNPVYTLGKSGKSENMLVSEEYLRSIGAEFFHIDRGGDITFHGPGQVVGYPILDLEQVGIGLREYIDSIEGAVIELCAEYGIVAGRVEGASGVWLDGGTSRARKICAIGVKSSRYVTMHGFALNVNTDLRYFNHINPCGFADRGVTSLQKELGREVSMEEVKEKVINHLSEKLNVKIYK